MYHAQTKSNELEKWFLSTADYFNTENELIDKNGYVKKTIHMFGPGIYGMVLKKG